MRPPLFSTADNALHGLPAANREKRRMWSMPRESHRVGKSAMKFIAICDNPMVPLKKMGKARHYELVN